MHFWGSIKTLGQGHGYGYITSGQIYRPSLNTRP